ncbi:MAG: ABC transporter ATP-binding protein [Actinobacteria bacterium]|nr:ABC transporter ATP-binding protein [Actinomycetota bacterium]
METLIETIGLRKTYGDRVAVDGIDLAIPEGEVFGLLGPNGAGKTTTVLMLLGLTEPDAGVVRVCGLDPTRSPLAVKRQVGYMPDTVGFYEDLTGRQNLRFTAWLNELDDDLAETQIDQLLEQVGLTEAGDLRVGAYSRGMRQRLGVADALIKDPRVVILDEPTVGIDPEGVIEMQGLISRLAKEEGRAVLLTSHMLHQVQQVCDRMAIFVGGRVVAEGSAEQLAAGVDEGVTVYEIVTPAEEATIRAVVDERFGPATPIGPGRWRVGVPASEVGTLFRALVDADVPVRQMRDLGMELDVIYSRYFGDTVEVTS